MGFMGKKKSQLKWKFVELKTYSKYLQYGRFVLSPLRQGQAETVGIIMRRTLLQEIEATCITRVINFKLKGALHEYSTIHEYSTMFGIEEPVQEIFMNLTKVVLKGDLSGPHGALVYAKGPGCVTAKDILLPPPVKVVDPDQYIATLTEPIDLAIELEIDRGCGFHMKDPSPENEKDESYPIDSVFMPIRNANYSIHSYGNDKQEMLFFEIWTNGSLTPQEAFCEALRYLFDLFFPFLIDDIEEEEDRKFF
uniref:RNA polymerase alpha subunit n=1 Tax=Goniothalamus tamirensis TaxID=553657 RepID=UPI0022FD5F0B|nr:RNA polymerase alpha subunit [Goniothalamus tamirensis]YP_010624107.1 RNA polymerase alpha subunit [Goniothalamus tamirensis]WBF98342.1 RNA polymerase alpha subunit [Goniothalamus tamirensis]WBF98393.1 RNA polymerase alpha subunit [Goniothalamus tamirensis]